MTILHEMVRPVDDATMRPASSRASGDGFLAEFETFPAALRWALELQAAWAKYVGTAGNPLHRPITFRIAIHRGLCHRHRRRPLRD